MTELFDRLRNAIKQT